MDGVSRRQADLAAGLASVSTRVDAAAAAVGRNPAEIELLPVTKFFPASDVVILNSLGCRSFGESREQEAAAKSAEVANLIGDSVRWHMVGQIQRNKARSIARWAYAVHSVSSGRAAAALGRAAASALEAGERAQPLRAYVQLSLDGDTTRGGVDIRSPAEVDEVCGEVAAAGGL